MTSLVQYTNDVKLNFSMDGCAINRQASMKGTITSMKITSQCWSALKPWKQRV